eukprot:c10893_g1_i2.p2 GENE.c10893_g1_i2~~c10893_g1_i2.p2  ORF type:complete len:324 (+),score=71.20 c10893_g1_i2:1358-2329(+)
MALVLARDICEGMAHLHTHNPPLIHRDLKTSNVLLVPRPTPEQSPSPSKHHLGRFLKVKTQITKNRSESGNSLLNNFTNNENQNPISDMDDDDEKWMAVVADMGCCRLLSSSLAQQQAGIAIKDPEVEISSAARSVGQASPVRPASFTRPASPVRLLASPGRSGIAASPSSPSQGIIRSMINSISGSHLADLDSFGLLPPGSSDEMTTVTGTLPYTAPEVLRPGPSGYDAKCDVFSMGVVLWELWTAREPCKPCGSRIFASELLLGYRLPLDEDIMGGDKAMINLIRRCWDQNPYTRPTFLQILQELDAMLRQTCPASSIEDT